MDGYTKNKLDKMAKIEQTTLDLLGKLPIKQIAVTEIAQLADVSKVTIFNYYESKNNLIKRVIFNHFQKIYDKYVEVVQSDLSFEAAYRTLTQFKLAEVQRNTAVFNQNVMSLYASDDSFYDQTTQEKSDQLMLGLVKKGRTDGSINPDYSDETILSVLHIYSEGMKIFGDKPEKLLALTDDLTAIFLNGLK
jgi:AcrR family transcriptional regulator